SGALRGQATSSKFRGAAPSGLAGTLSDMKTKERLRARELRAQGWSVKEIERYLGVSRSSVSLWVRNVAIGPAERRRLIERVRLGPIVAAERKAAAAREVRRGYQEEG